MSDLSIKWLRGLAEKGGKGIVNHIDARSLGRVADELEEAAERIAALASEPVAGTVGRDEIARILNDHFWTGEPGQRDAIKAATEALSALDGWQSADSVPPTKPGHMTEYVIAVYRSHSKKVYSFACSYLNAWPLEYQDECPKGAGCDGNGCDDGCPTTGWFILTGDGDNESGCYQEMSLKAGDKIMGWRDIPQWDGPAIPPHVLGAGAPADATHMRRPEYLTAYLFEEGATDIPAWLAAKYVGGPIPDHRFDNYAMAIDGDFWRWMDRDKFSELYTAIPATPPAPGAADRAAVIEVPLEPTREMWAAGANAAVGKTTVHHDVVVEAVYRAMVEAAPANTGETGRCPYPVISDHSARACIEAGHCGCDKGPPLPRADGGAK